jgi:plasmid replication initiation protein
MALPVDKRVSIKVVSANDFITAKELSALPLNSRKLLYLAISQCKKSDKEFYEYAISAKDFAEMMGIDESNIYRDGRKITGRLMGLSLDCDLYGQGYEQYGLFSKCTYKKKDGIIRFKLNPDMTNFFLNLKKDFSQPLLEDFVHMNSPYSMAIWHLMQREMHSKKPSITQTLEFDLTLAELRSVTGTESKLRQIGQFKERVLDKAIREIRDNCGVVVTYTNIKDSRTIVGFHFTAIQEHHVDEATIPEHIKRQVEEGKRRIAAEQQKRGIVPTLIPEPEELPLPEPQPHSRPLTQMEREQYQKQTADAEQLNFFEFLEKQ